MAAKDKRIADVRGLGAMVAIELCRDGDRTNPMQIWPKHWPPRPPSAA
jgi:4-aminobutyrate aminotransferase-like enzyme